MPTSAALVGPTSMKSAITAANEKNISTTASIGTYLNEIEAPRLRHVCDRSCRIEKFFGYEVMHSLAGDFIVKI